MGGSHHCRLLQTASDVSLLPLPVLHLALIGLRKKESSNSKHACSQIIQETIHTSQTRRNSYKKPRYHHSSSRNNSYIIEKWGGIQHITSTHSQIDLYITNWDSTNWFFRKNKKTNWDSTNWFIQHTRRPEGRRGQEEEEAAGVHPRRVARPS